MNAKINVFIITIITLGFFTNLLGQNAFYDASKLAKINEQDVENCITLVKMPEKERNKMIDESNLSKEKKEELKSMLDSGKLSEELSRGLHFLQSPWENPVNSETFIKVFQEVDYFAKYLIKPEREVVDILYIEKPSTPTSPTTATPGTFFNSTFQTNLIDAIGTLIAERFKEDVTTMYLNKLKDELNKSKYGDTIKLLLPETYDLVMEKDPFTYFSLGKELKAAFTKDLENLPRNIVKNMKKIAPKIADNKLFPFLKLAFEIADKLINGYHPVDILNYLDILYESKDKTQKNDSSDVININKNIYKVVHLLNLVQLNLQKHSETDEKKEEVTGWVSFADLKKLMDNKIKITYFLALIYWQDNSFFDKTKLKNKLINVDDFFTNKVVPIYQILVKINEFDKKSIGTSEDYATYMQLGLEMLQEAYYKILLKEGEKSPDVDLGFKIARKCLEIYKSIYKKDYKNLISQTYYILRELYLARTFSKVITETNEFKKIEELKEIGESLKMPLLQNPEALYSKNDLCQLKDEISKKIEELNDSNGNKGKLEAVIPFITKLIEDVGELEKDNKIHKFIAALAKYGAFIEGIANAKDAAEMKKVIATVILPSGSFLKKRTSPFSITITAHPGIFFGRERISNLEDTTQDNGNQPPVDITGNGNGETDKSKPRIWGNVGGFTAPIGIEFCKGSKNQNCLISSYGLFLSVIDLGAVVSYRLTKSSDEYNGMPDKITFKQIFAPGASLNFGFKNSPITLRLGVQYTPELRKIREEEIIVNENKSWRFFLGLSWDIPLLSITPKFKK